jgi:Lon protease-like protein
MFPLGSVLLPGELLPLHVFEPRYRQLVIDLLADDVNEPEFGVTLIERGHEVGGGDQRGAIGTMARIINVEALDEHRYGVVALGTRRISVQAWLPDDPYTLADIDDALDPIPDDVGRFMVNLAATEARVQQVHRLAVELGDVPEGLELELSDDPVMASYQLVSFVPLGPADRFRLLGASDPWSRLEVLDAALDDLEASLRFRSA